MVGIVLVSHSAQLALGLFELLVGLGSDGVPIVAVGGTADGRIGTDPDAVAAAVKEVDAGDGVVLIPDLGSSVLTIKALLEEDESVPGVLVDCPFVEGAVSATITASTGAALEDVVRAAEEARVAPKF